MKRVLICILCAVLLAVVPTSCRQQVTYTVENVSGTYTRPNDNGFDSFSITLNEDGTYGCFETMISSHLGIGEYTLEDGVVTLIDDQIPTLYGSLTHTYKFRCEKDKLIYLADESNAFMYVSLPDGAQFDRVEARENTAK